MALCERSERPSPCPYVHYPYSCGVHLCARERGRGQRAETAARGLLAYGGDADANASENGTPRQAREGSARSSLATPQDPAGDSMANARVESAQRRGNNINLRVHSVDTNRLILTRILVRMIARVRTTRTRTIQSTRTLVVD